MTKQIYRYFQFEEPYKCLMIATTEYEAVSMYEREMVDSLEGIHFVELDQSEFVSKLADIETEAMPTIERGLACAAIETQNALFYLAAEGKPVKVLASG